MLNLTIYSLKIYLPFNFKYKNIVNKLSQLKYLNLNNNQGSFTELRFISANMLFMHVSFKMFIKLHEISLNKKKTYLSTNGGIIISGLTRDK